MLTICFINYVAPAGEGRRQAVAGQQPARRNPAPTLWAPMYEGERHPFDVAREEQERKRRQLEEDALLRGPPAVLPPLLNIRHHGYGILSISVLCLATGTHAFTEPCVGQDYFARPNYGIVSKCIKQVRIIDGYITHAFHLELPVPQQEVNITEHDDCAAVSTTDKYNCYKT